MSLSIIPGFKNPFIRESGVSPKDFIVKLVEIDYGGFRRFSYTIANKSAVVDDFRSYSSLFAITTWTTIKPDIDAIKYLALNVDEIYFMELINNHGAIKMNVYITDCNLDMWDIVAVMFKIIDINIADSPIELGMGATIRNDMCIYMYDTYKKEHVKIGCIDKGKWYILYKRINGKACVIDNKFSNIQCTDGMFDGSGKSDMFWYALYQSDPSGESYVFSEVDWFIITKNYCSGGPG